MRVNLGTIDVDDDMRKAIRAREGGTGLATRVDVRLAVAQAFALFMAGDLETTRKGGWHCTLCDRKRTAGTLCRPDRDDVCASAQGYASTDDAAEAKARNLRQLGGAE